MTTFVQELRKNQKKFGKRLSVGELQMRIQSEEKFREDDPAEAAAQQRLIESLKAQRDKRLKRLLNGSR